MFLGLFLRQSEEEAGALIHFCGMSHGFQQILSSVSTQTSYGDAANVVSLSFNCLETFKIFYFILEYS